MWVGAGGGEGWVEQEHNGGRVELQEAACPPTRGCVRVTKLIYLVTRARFLNPFLQR